MNNNCNSLDSKSHKQLKQIIYNLRKQNQIQTYQTLESKQETSSLSRAIKNLESTLKSLGQAIITTDLDNKVVSMNSYAEELTGWKKDGAIGKSIDDVFNIVNSKTREKADNPVAKVLKYGRIVGLSNHTTLISKGGKEYHIADSGSPIKDDNENIIGVALVFRDITEKYRIRRSLRQSEEMYRAIFNNTGTATIIIEKDKTISLANKQFEKLSGYKKEQIEQKMSWTEFVLENDQKRMIKYHKQRRVNKNKVPNNYECIFIDKKGGFHNILLYVDMIPHSDRSIASLLDITERKQTKEMLKRSFRRLKTLLANLPGIAYRCKNIKNWRMQFISRGCKQLTGYDPSEIVDNKVISYEEIIHPDDREKVWGRVQKAISKNEHYELEYRIVTRNKNKKWVWERGVCVSSHDGKPNILEGFISDITQRKKAEIELEKNKETLHRLNTQIIKSQEEERKRISQYLHDDLGQYLTAVSINLSTITEGQLSNDCDPALIQRIEETIQTVNIISDKIHGMVYDLRPAILDDLGLIRTLEWYIERFEDRTNISVCMELSKVNHRFNRNIEIILYRIIQEALNNIAKHSNARKVNINISKIETLLWIIIQDDGEGFNVEKLNSKPVTNKGMGIPGIRERLLAIDGELQIESKIGKGTKLSINIPEEITK